MDSEDSVPLRRAEELRYQAQRLRLEFLLTELELAATFLEVANTTTSPETRERNVQNARKAHEEVTKLLTEKPFQSEEDRERIAERLAALRKSLDRGE